MNSPLVSVVIPTYNRFTYLLEAIESVKIQSYSNLEIIVVNDRSTDPRYYDYNWKAESVKFITLDKTTREQFGWPCTGHVRNIGIENCSGYYVAFLDDDDLWLKGKTEYQFLPMIEEKYLFSSTDGYWGDQPDRFVENKQCQLFNREKHRSYLQRVYGVENLPDVWDRSMLLKNNGVINSSAVVQRKLVSTLKFDLIPTGDYEDYKCWLKCLEYTNLRYYDKPTFYYDARHGAGRNY